MRFKGHQDIFTERAFTSFGGFTWKELLLTIASIALLILLFVGWRARRGELPRRNVCDKNLRELLSGFNSYNAEFGRLPSAARSGAAREDDWIFWQTERILEESPLVARTDKFRDSLRCPGDRNFSFRGYPYSYSMNVNLERLATLRIANDRQVILLYEEDAPNDGACEVGGKQDGLATRHRNQSNAGFLDGHVDRMKQKDGISPWHARP